MLVSKPNPTINLYRIKKTSILRNKEIKTRYQFTRFITRIILKKENIIRLKALRYFLESILIASSFNVLQIIYK
jgi:ribonucleotide reductase beta subunit family protein with ferritin-like domain